MPENRFRKSLYCLIPLVFVLLQYVLFYFCAKFLHMPYGPFNFETALDRQVPLIPWFIYIYVGSYIFWLVTFFVVASRDRDNFYALVASVTVTFFVCFLFYVFLPTTIVRPEIGTDTFTLWLLDLIYKADTPALNLFPSMHCLASWLCFIGVRRMKNISLFGKAAVCFCALAVFASTQFVKQHYMADLFGGVLLAELGAFFVRKKQLQRVFAGAFTKINKKLLKLE